MASAAAFGMTDADWTDFVDLANARHRVAPAVAEAMEAGPVALPGPVVQAVRAEARANGFAALAQKTESLRLAGALEAVGIRAIWLKGWPLAEQLYGAAGRRHSNDIDILVDADQRLAAAQCLAEAGYAPTKGHRLRGRLIEHPAIEAECKDVQYRNAETRSVVELHWRTSHFRAWPEFRNLNEEPRVLSGVAGPARILVPGSLGQLVYLAGHGQQHLFGRLKWLLDIARLAGDRGPDRLGNDLRRAEAAGAGRSVRLALHLAHRVFGAPAPSAASNPPPSEARWADKILAQIADPGSEPGRVRARMGFYLWHLRMAGSPVRIAGVLRYAFWRPPRLWMADLTNPEEGIGT